MNKLGELKKMLRQWKETKSMTLAHDICDWLSDNLNMEEE